MLSSMWENLNMFILADSNTKFMLEKSNAFHRTWDFYVGHNSRCDMVMVSYLQVAARLKRSVYIQPNLRLFVPVKLQ